MRSPLRTLLSASALAIMASSATAARADDLGPPTPNVLLLVDTSLSMEFMSGSRASPTCNPSAVGTSGKSRWIELVEVLTGTIPNDQYACNTVQRRTSAFDGEFSLGGVLPYDNVGQIYNRPLSAGCQPAPGSMAAAASAYEYPAGYFSFKNWQTGQPCEFNQYPDGLLDSFKGHIRFGLMTFDSARDPGTGVGAGRTPDYQSGMKGHWSYYVGTPVTGRPAQCPTDQPFEVGARSAAAPPWEGRMVAFGPPDEDPAMTDRNAWIQNILLTTRPYGPTPIAGMLDDARQFLWHDTSSDPLSNDPSVPFGPRNDPFVSDGCRQNAIVLLSDGEPNFDLRPQCEFSGDPAGRCPYERPEDIAGALAGGGLGPPTAVFVVGFSIASVTVDGAQKRCSEFTATDLESLCTETRTKADEALRACCVLNQIAYRGATEHAYFADNMVELRAALSAVLSRIASSATSRTQPVFASSGLGGTGQTRFFTSFIPKSFALWQGVVERQRWVCEKDTATETFTPVAQEIDPLLGDDFVANVNFNGSGRKFYWVQGAVDGGVIHSQNTMRPTSASADLVSAYTGTQLSATTETFPLSVSEVAMKLQADTGVCTSLTAAECRTRILKWLVGLDNGTAYHRCRNPGSADCSLIGHVYHSTPRVVGPPNELLRDENYALFEAEQQKKNRPTVLYTSTNDGFLHAFKIGPGVTSRTNNELWAFTPPAVLPLIPSEYPPKRVDLLDGSPVVRDVVATLVGTNSFKLERSGADARTAGKTTYRTILVQSFGPMQGGYFALDVTDPDPSAGADAGPKFLWQLTTDAIGRPLFGAGGATPLITTLYFGDTAGANPREVPVAVLPGGSGGAIPSSACDVATDPDNTLIDMVVKNATGDENTITPRAQVRCWAPTPARSLTIVRLDDGSIVRSFRGSTGDYPSLMSGVVTLAPLNSPITGQPAAYPGGTGAIADRIFVGDADGLLWRIDVSSTDPSKWKMKRFWDGYAEKGPLDGQMVVTPPIVSTDQQGQVTVAYSTGDQEARGGADTMTTYAWSLRELFEPGATLPKAEARWRTELTAGERVTGPMSMFNGSLYFSTFKPLTSSTNNVCGTGTSRIWGMDYLEQEVEYDHRSGGKGRMPSSLAADATLVQFIDNSSSLIESGASIFGVTVAQVMTCYEESSGADPVMGGSRQHTTLGNVTPGKFQLVMHTSRSGTSTSDTGGLANVTTVDLPTPPSTAIMDSWAAIVE